MKAFAVSIVFTLMLASQAVAQVDFIGQCTPEQRAAAVFSGRRLTQAVFADQLTARERAAALKKALENAKPGFFIPNGIYDFGAERPRLPGFKFDGESVDGVVIRTAAIFSATNPCCVECVDGTDAGKFTVESTCGPDKQSCAIGLTKGEGKAFDGRTLTLRQIRVKDAPVFGIYHWNGVRNNIIVDACDVTAGRCGIIFGVSGGNGTPYQTGSVTNSTITLKPELSNYQGAVTNKLYGGAAAIVVRGGPALVDNVTITGTGGKLGPRIVGITDWYDSGSSSTNVTLGKLTMALRQGAAKEIYDLDFRLGKCTEPTGTGSAADGSFLRGPLTK